MRRNQRSNPTERSVEPQRSTRILVVIVLVTGNAPSTAIAQDRAYSLTWAAATSSFEPGILGPRETTAFGAGFELRRSNALGLRATIGTSHRVTSNHQRDTWPPESTFVFGRIALGLGARLYPSRTAKDGFFLEAMSFAWIRSRCEVEVKTAAGRRSNPPCVAMLPSDPKPYVRSWGSDWGLGLGYSFGVLPISATLRYEHSVMPVIRQGQSRQHARAILLELGLSYVSPGSRSKE